MLALLVLGLVVLPAGGLGATTARADTALRDVTYCTAGGVQLKMDIFPPTLTQSGPAPVIMYVHGGSWQHGDKWEIGLAADQLAARGYLVTSINYRLAPDYKWPAQIEDVKCAVRYLRANAAKYNLDPNRIGAWGSSAGGHLVAMLGLAGPGAGFEGNGGYQDQPSAVQAVVDMFGPSDLIAFDLDMFAQGVSRNVFGVLPGQPKDVLVRASPVTYVSEDAPPFLIIQGDKDRLVPPGQSQELYDKLKSAGATAQLVMVQNAGHGLVPAGGDINPSTAQIAEMIPNFFDRYLHTGSQLFPETGKTVNGDFLAYWKTHGGLAQQGYPISEEMQERSDVDGKTYTVQYFERAVFERHPENKPPYDVLLSLLGDLKYKQKYPNGAPNQKPNTSPGSVLFAETGKRLGGKFLDYWNSHGGVQQQGYPISDEFTEVSELDGKPYLVQYFERAVFEYHPENKPPNDVLLSQLGMLRYRAEGHQ
jgi:acetyl esterase/lipase